VGACFQLALFGIISFVYFALGVAVHPVVSLTDNCHIVPLVDTISFVYLFVIYIY